MKEIAELEQRITAALERIGKGVDRLSGQARPAASAKVEDKGGISPEVAALKAQLEEEKTHSAQLKERLRAVKDKDGQGSGQLQEKVNKLTLQLDVQGLELQRMRRTAVSLREQLHQLRKSQTAAVVEPQLINKSILAELEAFRATRLTEMAEMDEILAALEPHLTEAENA
ncbi:MAG: hypothetical protein HC844_10355 [Tabrizicola sp.]|nr:hypothetical protein [Tabrizicola sp.]